MTMHRPNETTNVQKNLFLIGVEKGYNFYVHSFSWSRILLICTRCTKTENVRKCTCYFFIFFMWSTENVPISITFSKGRKTLIMPNMNMWHMKRFLMPQAVVVPKEGWWPVHPSFLLVWHSVFCFIFGFFYAYQKKDGHFHQLVTPWLQIIS